MPPFFLSFIMNGKEDEAMKDSGTEKKLRSGFTTGTCAALAAGGAAAMLLTGIRRSVYCVKTPKGTVARLRLLNIKIEKKCVTCGVKKDAGDDPDVTDQAMVFASVEYFEAGMEAVFRENGTGGENGNCGENGDFLMGGRCYRKGKVYLTGGQGIGLITKEGLACPVGYHAINPVPRQMIFKEVEAAADRAGFGERLLVRISIPQGEGLAAKTFNPRLGIAGGLSVLGTSGIVEPMSEAALKATIRLELHMKAAAGRKRIILTPGNYGERFLKEDLGLSISQGVLCSNFIGETVKMAREEGLNEILFVGHAGKLIKAAGGVYNTHSKYGDRRMEILWDCMKGFCERMAGDQRERLKERVMAFNTTEEAVGALDQLGLRKPVMEEAANRIKRHMETWYGGPVRVETVIFSNLHGCLGMTAGALPMIREFGRDGQETLRTV